MQVSLYLTCTLHSCTLLECAVFGTATSHTCIFVPVWKHMKSIKVHSPCCYELNPFFVYIIECSTSARGCPGTYIGWFLYFLVCHSGRLIHIKVPIAPQSTNEHFGCTITNTHVYTVCDFCLHVVHTTK